MIRATILIETILNSCLEQRARSRLMQSIREPALILYEGESETGNSGLRQTLFGESRSIPWESTIGRPILFRYAQGLGRLSLSERRIAGRAPRGCGLGKSEKSRSRPMKPSHRMGGSESGCEIC